MDGIFILLVRHQLQRFPILPLENRRITFIDFHRAVAIAIQCIKRRDCFFVLFGDHQRNRRRVCLGIFSFVSLCRRIRIAAEFGEKCDRRVKFASFPLGDSFGVLVFVGRGAFGAVLIIAQRLEGIIGLLRIFRTPSLCFQCDLVIALIHQMIGFFMAGKIVLDQPFCVAVLFCGHSLLHVSNHGFAKGGYRRFITGFLQHEIQRRGRAIVLLF